MGWVGVAIIVATTCFILYRHPPATWFPEPPAADQARTPKPTTEEKGEKTVPRGIEDKRAVPSAEPEPQHTDAKDEPIEESQTTPKASPSNNVLTLDVPSFQLNDAETTKETTPQAVNPSLMPPQSTTPAPSTNMNKSDSDPSPSPAPATTPQPPVANKADASLMPPPPPPSRLRPLSSQRPPRPQPQSSLAPPPGRFPPPRPNAGSTLAPPPSAASSLRVPPGAGSRPTTNSMNSLSPTPVTLKPAKKASQRAVLEPGFSPLDWAALTSNPNHKLRGANMLPGLIKVTPSMLKAQHGRKGMDAWTSYQGKVYNITPYLPFHPGGKGELLRGAGKDSGKLFLEIHPWVNWDAILGECLVGILVSEHEAVQENTLDAMD
ncbi:uncharacterized protein BDV17DRAFT_296723 [Aspergillus undulatus]|uniref:uncharacterized protein n=1 Tax=Aspergillus undulatus TaxID=1810928 RepID=UPI003CCCF591